MSTVILCEARLAAPHELSSWRIDAYRFLQIVILSEVSAANEVEGPLYPPLRSG
jgi:hypothetical protein